MENKEILDRLKSGLKLTNCFKPIVTLARQIVDNSFTYLYLANNNFILEKSQHNFSYLHFYIAKQDNLLDTKLPEDLDLVCEILYKKPFSAKLGLVDTFLNQNNLKFTSTFNRMQLFKKNQVLIGKAKEICSPKSEDLEELHFLLIQNFNVYEERIPTISELEKLKKSTFIIKEQNKIVAVLVSEHKGQTTELRYWLVLPNYRDKKYGSILMKHFLNYNLEINRYLLWVNSTNYNAISKYKHYGFLEENLHNKIYIRNLNHGK